MYEAYRSRRTQVDPSEGWYQGELNFFDYYVIPLARKLEECRVFGVSSDECLNYALQNRSEWSLKGKTIVEKYLESVRESSMYTHESEPAPFGMGSDIDLIFEESSVGSYVRDQPAPLL